MLYVLTLLIGDAAATSRVDSTSLRPSPSLAAANAMVPRIGRSLAVACCLLPPQSFMAFYGVHKEIWLFMAFYGFLWRSRKNLAFYGIPTKLMISDFRESPKN
jgi:hypothetical protein